MRIACPNCRTSYSVEERRIPATGLNVRCPKCQTAFPVRPETPVTGEPIPVALPTPAPFPAAPDTGAGLTGATGRMTSPFGVRPLAEPLAADPFAPPPASPPGSTISFETPFDPPVPSGATRSFGDPFESPTGRIATPPLGTVALPAPPTPEGAVELSLADPLAEAAAPGVPLPVAQPGATLSFGEVDLVGAAPHQTPLPFDDPLPAAPPSPPFTFDDPLPTAPEAPGPLPFAPQEPLPVESPPPTAPAAHVPLPADPFASAPAGAPGMLGKSEAEELEALFEEKARRPADRPSASGGPAWRVRRRSGKVFGPFPEDEVVQMLGRGELLGNEDVSRDGDSWDPIAEVAAFSGAIRALIQQPAAGEPGRATPAAAPGDAGGSRPRGPSLGERLAGLRERLADATSSVPAWGRHAALGTLAGLVIFGGLAVGLTDYGVFFHRLIRGQVGPSRPGAALCVEARVHFGEDTWKGAQAALELTGRALSLSSVDREARAIRAQLVGWMARRTGVSPELLARAQADLADLQQRSAAAPDALKARLSMALASGAPAPDAAGGVERWLARTPGDEDAAYLLGEWALSSRDLGRAEAFFQRLEQTHPTARSAHALGLVGARRDARAARAHFETALQRDPQHLASRLEIATLQLQAGDLPAAARSLEALLGPADARGLLGPRERARARQLRGELLARQLGDSPETRLAEAEKELAAAVQEDPGYLPARAAWARFLMRRNAPARALEALQPAVAGGGAEIVDLHVRALAGTGRALDAVTALDAARERLGPSPRLTFARGLVTDAGGKRAEAEKLYAEAAAGDPGYWEPHLALGRSRLRGRDLEGAAKEILLSVEKAPGEADAQAGLGELRLARGDLGGAEEAWRKALGLDPAHAPSLLGLARVALARDDPAGAAAGLERAVRFDPRLADAHELLGRLRWKKGDLPGAAAAFKEAASIDPRNALARTRQGAVELELGKLDPALDDLLAASNIEVALPENRFWLGRAYLAKGDFQAAAEQLGKAVDLEPDNALHHLWLGISLDRASKLSEAGDAYRAALQADPRQAEAAERLGLLLANLNRCGEAVPLFDKAIALAPREQRLRMELADCRVKLGQPAQAIQIYKDALKSDPKLVELYYRVARAIHESSGIAQAVPWYEKAAQLDRENPMPHYYLGFSLKVRGQKAKAVEAFRAYLRLKPDADDKKDILREIEDLGG